jgi:tetratricopeptide (TPR) repeat protein
MSSSSIRLLGGVALLALLLALAYGPALRGGYLWDDDSYLARNPNLTSAEGLRKIWLEPRSSPQYYPLVFTGLWFERRLWGPEPFGYHAVNVLLHLLNSVLLWLLLRRFSLAWAWLAAMVFALHPVHVESVAWITERKNVLSTALYLGAVSAYLDFDGRRGAGEEAQRRRWASYAISLVLFVGALLSKSVTASLPAALLLAAWWKRGRIGRRDIGPLAPMFLAGAVLGMHTAYLEKYHVGARGPDWDFSWLERILIAGRSIWFYAGKLAWPDPLIFFYPRWKIDTAQASQYLYPLGAAVVVCALWAARHALGRGPLAAVLFFGGTLLPASGLFNVFPMRFSFVADHFQYLASIGLISLFAGSLHRLLTGFSPHGGERLLKAAGAGLAIVLAILTWRQSRNYADQETLWRATLAKNDMAFVAHNNLGTILEARGELDEAMFHFERAWKLKPDIGEYPYNLGVVLERMGRTAEAAEAYASAHLDLGVVLVRMGREADAERHYREAIGYKPGLAQAHYGLGMLLASQGRAAEAAAALERARAIDPARGGAP